MPPVEDNIISWSEWEKTYEPLTEQMLDFVEDAEWMAGRSEESPANPYRIWTVVDNNPNSVYLDILPGFRMFNRLGFFVTRAEWTDKDMVVSNDPSYS